MSTLLPIVLILCVLVCIADLVTAMNKADEAERTRERIAKMIEKGGDL